MRCSPNNSFKVSHILKENPTLVMVVAAALIDAEGRVLMQQRPLAKEHGGLWEFPGGKVDAGESLAQSLARELAEELGIGIEPDDIAPLTFASAEGQRPVILLYTCHRWHGTPVCLEGEAIGWFAPDALAGLEMPPLDVPLAAALAALPKSAN